MTKKIRRTLTTQARAYLTKDVLDDELRPDDPAGAVSGSAYLPPNIAATLSAHADAPEVQHGARAGRCSS